MTTMAPLPTKSEVDEPPRLPMPSKNPLPLSAGQEAQVRELYHSRVRGYCAVEIKAFADCAMGRTFTAPFVCKPQRLAMNSCMISHATRDEQDAAREEWFATRLKRQKEREEKEARRIEQEKFHRSIYPDGLQGCEIRQAEDEGRGLGVFATRDILPGTVLLAEKPLLVSVEIGTRADPIEVAFKALTPSQKTAYRSLHAYRPRVLHDSLNRSIVYTNGFAIGPGNNKTGVFLLGSRFNHSCVANTTYVWHNTIKVQKVTENGETVEEVAKGRMVFTNHYKLLEGEEVTIDYGHKPAALKKFYGFECDCGGCTDPGSSPASSTESEEKTEDRASVEKMRIEREKELLKQEWLDPALKRRWSLPAVI